MHPQTIQIFLPAGDPREGIGVTGYRGQVFPFACRRTANSPLPLAPITERCAARMAPK